MTMQVLDDRNEANSIESVSDTAKQPAIAKQAIAQSQVQVTDSDAVLCYANFCRVPGHQRS
jgi:hypothetical protein